MTIYYLFVVLLKQAVQHILAVFILFNVAGSKNLNKMKNILILTNILVFCYLILHTKAEWNTKDYLRKEHSLMKPYSGMYTL